MPISSGAEGHVGVGVDTSIKWFPEGGGRDNRTELSYKSNNSYLQRYLCSNPEARKRNSDGTSAVSGIPNKSKSVYNITPSSKSTEPQSTQNKPISKNENATKHATYQRNHEEQKITVTYQEAEASNVSPASSTTKGKDPVSKVPTTKSSVCILL